MTARISSATASPCRARPDDHRLAFGRRLQERPRPPLDRQVHAYRLGRPGRVGSPGDPSRIMPAPAPWHRGCTGWPRPPCRPSRRPPDRGASTCCRRGRAGHQRGDVGVLDEHASASRTRCRCRPPRPGHSAAPPLDQARLECGERHGLGPHRPSPGAAPGRRRRPRGCRWPAHAPGRHSGASYDPGTRCRRRRRSRGRRVAAQCPPAPRHWPRPAHAPGATAGEDGGGDAAVGPVTALAGHDDDPASVRAPQKARARPGPPRCPPARRASRATTVASAAASAARISSRVRTARTTRSARRRRRRWRRRRCG